MKGEKEKKHVLLVEDDASVVAWFRSVLPGDSYMIYSVETGEEAIEVIMGVEFDIIILDYRLRGEKNGFHVLEECREITGAVIYSNTGSPAHSYRMSLLGCDYALHKNSYIIHKAFRTDRLRIRRGHIDNALREYKTLYLKA